MSKWNVSEQQKERSKLTKDEWREYTKSVWRIANKTHEEHPSMFPEEIPKRLVKMFSFVDETVLDPFSGVSTTGKACLKLDRNYIGVDTNEEYLEISENRLSGINNKDDVSYSLKQCDSKDMDFLEDDSISLIITSPPYWNKADYGEYTENIGDIDNYNEFLSNIKPVFEECYRVLEPGRRMCIVTASVNQNTTDGLVTFPLATDFINLCRDLGFLLVNKVIWSKDKTGGQWGSANQQKPIFGSYPHPPSFLFKNIHEYIVIIKKPGEKKSNSEIPNYKNLVGDVEYCNGLRVQDTGP